MNNKFLVFDVLLFFLVSSVTSFYLPGLAPKVYCRVDKSSETCKSRLDLFVNRLDSVESVLPYEYTHFDFCQSVDNSASPSENLGQVVFGERIRPSPYKFDFLENVSCKEVCTKTYRKSNHQDVKNLDFLLKAIKFNYQQHFIVDNLPVIWCFKTTNDNQYCSRGFPIGCLADADGEIRDSCKLIENVKTNTYYIFNHLDFEIIFHSGENEEWGSSFSQDGGRIVNVRVNLRSINHFLNPTCNSFSNNYFEINKDFPISDEQLSIKYTYSVIYAETHEIKWASRWDFVIGTYSNTKIQWFSILNSVIIVVFLSGMIGVVLVRSIRKDLGKYNSIRLDEQEDEFGWKTIHGDVFRPPIYTTFLSVCIGSGVQLIAMAVITLGFACLGFLSPASRGALMTTALVCYVLLGSVAGYVSARLHKMFVEDNKNMNIILTAVFCPGVVFTLFFLLNLILWYHSSSAAIPFGTLVALLALWFCVSSPLVFVGSYLGFKQKPIENPVRVNQIPRQIISQNFYTRRVPGILMGGILPFGCIYVQLFFILNSIWSHQFYYMFGFLTVVYIILIITCSETTILLCYFHLCSEDYRWWWRSFLTSGFAAVYFFMYAINFYVTKLDLQGAASTFLYFGYTLIMTFLFFLVSGTIGFLACYWFIRLLYKSIRVD